MNSESSPIDSKGPTMIKVQKGTKNIGKVVQLEFYEATRILFVRKENKNNFIQQFISSASPWRHFGEHHNICACFDLNVNKARVSVRGAADTKYRPLQESNGSYQIGVFLDHVTWLADVIVTVGFGGGVR